MFELFDHALGTPLCAVTLIASIRRRHINVVHHLLACPTYSPHILESQDQSSHILEPKQYAYTIYIYIMFVYVNTPTITSLKFIDLYFTDILINLQVV